MTNKNKQFLYLFLMGWIGIIIGSGLKISGNENYELAIGTAIVMKFIATFFLIFYNFSKIKSIFRS